MSPFLYTLKSEGLKFLPIAKGPIISVGMYNLSRLSSHISALLYYCVKLIQGNTFYLKDILQGDSFSKVVIITTTIGDFPCK